MAFNNKSFKSKPIVLLYVGKNGSELENVFLLNNFTI
jgi:hypothetical protein